MSTWDCEIFVLKTDDIKSVIDFIDCNPNIALIDLAYTLQSRSEGQKLVIIANSVSDLHEKLLRAKDRLSHSDHIHDTAGIYYNKEQLVGKIAFLFPGEGAQYPNMLGDLLPHFPPIQEYLKELESFSVLSAEDNLAIKKLLYMPSDDCEQELKKLGIAMFSVTVVDWALFRLLSKFGIKAQSFAGHSMGELAALGAAGCLEVDANFLQRVNTVVDELQTREVNDFCLIAVGSGRTQMIELVKELDLTDVYVSMDNCPHQSVIAGPHAVMAKVQHELQKRYIFAEKLPFSRPYHTELFEPHLKPLHKVFENVEFRSPKAKVYSGSTGQPFPENPEDIRRISVNNWAAPVEFTKTIETMYGDGMRIFLEVGPKGNLTAFVADILRKKPHAALAVNVQRRSGLTQLAHVLGQLISHNVGVDLTEWYCRRNPKSIARSTSRRVEVMHQYFNVMEQFLDLQGDVLRQFLQRKQAPVVQRPLLGEKVRFEIGKTWVSKRRMDLKEDLFANHHTVGGRSLSRVNPEHYGLPVIPGTFSLEMMAEAASMLIPGMLVVQIKDVRLSRWIAYDEDDPTVIEITATKNGDFQVDVEIRDLGTVLKPLESAKRVARASVIFASNYPKSESAVHTLTDPRPSKIPLDVMYDNLFHGALFQGVIATNAVGDKEIDATVEVLDRKELFQSTNTPNFIIDPVLTDVCMHPFVTWHLEQPDQSGRILLPAEISSLNIYAPVQPVGTQLTCRGRISESSNRHFVHDAQAISKDGNMLFELKGVKLWRFYVPFGEVNFHGSKDSYFLSREWSMPTVENLSRCMRLTAPADLKQPGMRLVTARVTLSPDELKEFNAMQASNARLDEWLFGRIAAKDAIRQAYWDKTKERLFPADIEIQPDVYGRPIGKLRLKDREPLPSVSIAHSEGTIVALAGFDPYVGIDIEKIKPREESFELMAFDSEERKLLGSFNNRYEAITRFWCAKEAVAKALGRGLVEGPGSLYVRGVDHNCVHIMLGKCLSAEFPQFAEKLFIANTVCDDEMVVATTHLQMV